jgi:predicted DNA-binding WGR domain protein
LRLVRQVQLFFQEGTSDKVYEIDLCEAGEGFIVNFRYGRRGAALKEGTKTIFPVALAEAEKLFNALEQEKRKKGYVAAGEVQIITSAEPKKPGTDKRKKAIIKILKTAVAGEEPEHWKLSRVIWRAGDLKIQEAIPYVIQIADPADKYNIYSSVWAIGRCGTDKAIPFLQGLQQKNLPEFTKQLVQEVLLKLSTGKDKEALLTTAIQALPVQLKKNITEKNYRELEKQLRELLFELKTSSNEYLVTFYQVAREDQALHGLFLKVVNDIPCKANYFKYLRHIFKTAEMLEDYATYGIIAKNIEKQAAASRVRSYMLPEDKKGLAFTNKTKDYLTHRVIRFLRKYGEAGEQSYTTLATELLLAFNDTCDLSPAYHTSQVSYQYHQETRTYTTNESRTDFDSYSRFQAFNFILYKNSPRYTRHSFGWMVVPPYTPGAPAPSVREEGFPQLWDKAPGETIRLLSFSQCFKVHEFALKVFRANPGFEQQVDIPGVIHFLGSAFAETQQLGLELARKKYDKNTPDKQLLIALLDSNLEAARKQAEQWIAEQKTTLLTDTEFLAELLRMRKPEAHAWLRGFLTGASVAKEHAEITIAKIIAFLVTHEIQNEEDERHLAQVADTMVIAFPDSLRHISLDVIKDMFRHTSAVIHTLAGKILMKHETRPENLPEDFLHILLQSDNINSRGIGIELLGRFPENRLLDKKDILVSFCLSPLPDVRNAVKPLIFRLVKAYPAFGKELVYLFVPAFLIKESYEGLHEDLLHLLSNELSDSLHVISKEKTLLLLNSRFRTSQLIGNVLLKKNITDDMLTVPELVKLASNPLEEVRLFAWSVFKKYPAKVKAEKEEALRITDSPWDDTRIFAFDYFRYTFAPPDWNTDLLVALCDSIKEDVQAFGREMITRFFQEQNGTEYLLKLSQHPNTKIQLFTTAYLEKYAADNLTVLQTLKPYFVTLLSQVNKGRVAKARAMDFLQKEAAKNEESARLASEIFTRVSVSVSITERAECIAALRDIRKKYPAIQSPIVMKKFSDYSKV